MSGSTFLRLTVGIFIGYSTLCAILLGLSVYFAYRAEWKHPVDAFVTFALLVIYLSALGHFLVAKLGRFLEAAVVADRGTALKLYVWVYSPLLLALGIWCCAQVLEDAPVPITIPGLRTTGLDQALRWVAILASVMWILVSAPIARLWATNAAQDPETFLNAEELLFVSARQRDFEARVSVPSYYALVLSLLAMLFLILDSIVGELFEQLTGISGYIGAVVASVVVATMLYPVHRRFNAFIARMRQVAQESGRADAYNALKSAIESTHQLFSADGTLAILYTMLIFYLIGWGFVWLASRS